VISKRDFGRDFPQRNTRMWITWAGLVPGDHVLVGQAGAWEWWEVIYAGQDGSITVRSPDGDDVDGHPPLDQWCYIEPVTPGARTIRAIDAERLVSDIFGGVLGA